MVAEGLGGEEVEETGGSYLMGTEFQFCKMKNVLDMDGCPTM